MGEAGNVPLAVSVVCVRMANDRGTVLKQPERRKERKAYAVELPSKQEP